MKKYLIGASLIGLIIAVYRAELLLVVWVLLGVLFVITFIVIVLASWYGIERMKMIRADRIEKEKNAHVLTVYQYGQFWVRDTDHKSVWHGLHLEQRAYSNGRYAEATESEKLAWRIFNTKPAKTIESQETLALPEPQQINLLDALDRSQRTLIVGSSGSGKTSLLQNLIIRKGNQRVIVLDPHATPNKWPCEQVIGKGRDYEAIGNSLASLVRLMNERYDQLGKGEVAEGDHDPITIIIDEWRAIVMHCDNASDCLKLLLTESRKVVFSVYVATHSDRAKPLGLEGEFDLRDGFAIVRLWHEAGRYLATISDSGNTPKPAIVPGPFIQPVAAQNNDQEFSLPEPTLEPDEQEQQILELWQQGIPRTRISMQVFGNKGGKQSQRIQEVINTFGGATSE